MTTNTSNLNLITYNSTTDASAPFLTFRNDLAGTSNSNMNKIDAFAGAVSGSIVTLQSNRPIVPVPASFVSANYYEATGISQITNYATNQIINFIPNQTTDGTVTLNINGLGTRTLRKVDSSGSPLNFTAGEMLQNHEYLFRFNGTDWVSLSNTSASQSFVNTINFNRNLSGSDINVQRALDTLDDLITVPPNGALDYYLKANQSGLPYWDVATDLSDNSVVGGRLSAQSNNPAFVGNATSSTLYYTPYTSNKISLWANNKWRLFPFTEISVNPGTVTTALNYDYYAYASSSGTVLLESYPWSNDTTRTSNVPIFSDGVWVLNTDKTRRYLGTVRHNTGASAFIDTDVKRHIWNKYNQVQKVLNTRDTTSPHTYNGTYRLWNNDPSLLLEWVVGDTEIVTFDFGAHLTANASGAVYISIGIDVTNSYSFSLPASTPSTVRVTLSLNRSKSVNAGFHYAAMLEEGNGIFGYGTITHVRYC